MRRSAYRNIVYTLAVNHCFREKIFFSETGTILFLMSCINVGYLLINSKPIERIGFELDVQHLGFAFLIAGLLWAGRHKLDGLLKIVAAKLKPRNAPLV